MQDAALDGRPGINARDGVAPARLITCIVLCRNEARHIARCLESILAFELPQGYAMECIVVDGRSDDGSRAIIAGIGAVDSRVRLVDNPERVTPFAMNAGIYASQGDPILILGAHTGYPRDYLTRCVGLSAATGADNVGGLLDTAVGTGAWRAACAMMMSHVFAAGGSAYRTSVASCREVETVFGGCYRRGVFERVGLFHPRLLRAQDREFNARLRSVGGRVLLDPSIRVSHYPRTDLWRHLLVTMRGGFWVVAAQRISGTRLLKWRNFVPSAFVALLIGALGALAIGVTGPLWVASLGLSAYFVIALYFSVHEGIQRRQPALTVLLPAFFFLTHVSYGLGSLAGFFGWWFMRPSRAPRL